MVFPIYHDKTTNNIFINAGKADVEIQNWKELLCSIVEQMSEEDDELKPIVQFLVTMIQPARIYRIKHFNVEIESQEYIDLLIVVPSSNRKQFVELEPILEIPYVQNKIISCSLHNEGSLKEYLTQGHIFYSLYCVDENIIYDNGKTNLPAPSPETLDKMKQKISSNFSLEIQKAIDFKETAAYLFEKGTSPLIGFLLHQSIELTYRSVLKSLNGYDKKTHSLHALRRLLRRCAPQLCEIFADNVKDEELLEDAYLSSRYKTNFNIENEMLSNIFDKVTLLQEGCVNLIDKQTPQSATT